MHAALKPEVFRQLYRDFAAQNPKWNEIPASTGQVYQWDEQSTYIQQPPFFENFSLQPGHISEIKAARPLGIFGDSVTTDHISPAGSIKKTSPAGSYLIEHGVNFVDFNSYGSRRGNDRVMTRGTFANVRIKNLMTPGIEGGVTKFQPGGETMSIFDAAMKYAGRRTPLIVLAGTEYGTGSSRDWAAKGTRLLGVRVVVAQSFERIHRSNLVGMGVLPLQFKEGVSAQTLKLDGTETYDVLGLSDHLKPRQDLTLRITRAGGRVEEHPGDLPHRYAHRDRLLPARRDSALCPAAIGRRAMSGQCFHFMVVVSALCADFEPQARHYTKLKHHQKAVPLASWGCCAMMMFLFDRSVAQLG